MRECVSQCEYLSVVFADDSEDSLDVFDLGFKLIEGLGAGVANTVGD